MKKLPLFTILAVLSIASIQAANIVLVSDLGVATDDSWYTPLNTYFEFGGADTLSFGSFTDHTNPGTISTLTGADLIVFTRNTNSANFTGSGESTFWNSLAAPIIMSSNLLLRDTRFGWANSSSTTVGDPAGAETTLSAAGASFLGLTAGDQDLFINGNQGMANTNTFGDGIIYGTDKNSPLGVGIVHWDAGDSAANGDVFGGERLFIGTNLSFTLNTAGDTAFNNAIGTMIPEPSSILMSLLGFGLVGLVVRRRK
ncbi:PEP-CTERM sorting domain-containing protein [Kiritimatiellaeota bacterium B1221]|nr:PEP-CTERM sorting domain-containing protein [Kiritimatiellaeota bacterium B1221]